MTDVEHLRRISSRLPENIREIRHPTRPRLNRIPYSGKSGISRRLILHHDPRYQCRVEVSPYLNNLTLSVPSRHPCVGVIEWKASSKNICQLYRTRAQRLTSALKASKITIVHHSPDVQFLRRPLLIAPAHNILNLHTMRLRCVLYLGDASDGIDQEDGFIIINSRQRVRALHIPIHVVDHIGVESAGVAGDKGVEEIGDVAARGVFAVIGRGTWGREGHGRKFGKSRANWE